MMKLKQSKDRDRERERELREGGKSKKDLFFQQFV